MIDSCQPIKNSQTMKWKRKMPEDYFLLVNLSLVSRMELFDIIYHLLVTMVTCMLCSQFTPDER